MSFVGGKLKLKGGEPLKSDGGVQKKKKKKKASSKDDEGGSSAAAEAQDAPGTIRDGYVIEQPADADKRTEAEKKYEAHMRKLEADRMKKTASKSHRERVKEFNEYLTKLTEHYDIPKVGPG